MSFILLVLWFLFGWVMPESAWYPSLVVVAVIMFFEGCYWTRASGIFGGLMVAFAIFLGFFGCFSMGGAVKETAIEIFDAPVKNDWSTGTMIVIGVVAALVVMFIAGLLGKK